MRRYFITGLLIWIPLVITVWVLSLLIGLADRSLLLLPTGYQPENLVGFYIPGIGVILTLLIVFATGILAANFLGRRLVRYWEALLGRIPVVKTIYSSVKHISDTLFSGGGVAFRKALLVQYPLAGSWTIAFLTGHPGDELARNLEGEHINVFVPTTPNPTSGFFLMVRKSDTIELSMSVDQALKYVISAGVVASDNNDHKPAIRG
ncbi:MAG: DUF502 domain-containing protein [Burkholderiales bacterium]